MIATTDSAEVRERSTPALLEATATPPSPAVTATKDRLAVLDGWRGISIISVLACHLLPLGPKSWQLNGTAGPFGMAIFFTLSGFLITSNLLHKPDVPVFFIRRACRILPLAYLFVVVALALQGESAWYCLSHLLFGINYQTQYITEITSPLWSLCVEVHFYLFVGLLVAVCGRRGLLVLPLLALLVTITRISQGTIISIHTHLRVDEILAGAAVALVHASSRATALRNGLARVPPFLLLGLLAICCHPLSGPLGYFRPYAASLMVACTLWRGGLGGILLSRPLKYFADMSYALYVIHPIMRYGWLGSGDLVERYLVKRPVGFVIVFVLAHLSTFYYERRWIEWGKRWSSAGSMGRTSVHTTAKPVGT